MARTTALAFPILAALSLAACSKSDTAPPPEHNDVAKAMPDAASTPGATGPATLAPHATPPPASTPLTPPPTAPTPGPSPAAGPHDHPE